MVEFPHGIDRAPSRDSVAILNRGQKNRTIENMCNCSVNVSVSIVY